MSSSLMRTSGKKRVLIFVVSFNAERTITDVLNRIPGKLFDNNNYITEVLIIDDCSIDKTFETGYEYKVSSTHIPITILKNPQNLGYGSNQKLGYRYAIENGFDIVVLLHGDGQYAPEELPKLLDPLVCEECDAVFGSRMMIRGTALRGGMPLYKYVGNKVLTWLQNRIVGTKLSEYHSGYRLYSCKALSTVPFEYNSNGFDFDTDIIIQFHNAGLKIKELPIPTFYGDEICHVNGVQYGIKILLTCLQSRIQKYDLLYNRKFYTEIRNNRYKPKFHFFSSHSLGLEATEDGENVLLLGCGPVDLVKPFVLKGCIVTAVDKFVSAELREMCKASYQADLDEFDFSCKLRDHVQQKILALDIIEHLRSPEPFLEKLKNTSTLQDAEVIITTPNIAFLPIRIMLLLGFFNYGNRGILDKTHTRLFTFRSLKTLLLQCGFEVQEMKGIPAPFPIALGQSSLIAKLLLRLNSVAISIAKGLFSYQIYCVAKPRPTIQTLLIRTINNTEKKLAEEQEHERSAESNNVM